MIYVCFGTKSTQGLEYYAVDDDRLSEAVCKFLYNSYDVENHIDSLNVVCEVPDSFYELMSVLKSNDATYYMVSRRNLVTLFAKDQVPYSPAEFDSILTTLKRQQDIVDFPTIYPHQIFVGNIVYKAAHLTTKGYRNFDLTSTIDLGSLQDDTPAYIDESDKLVSEWFNDYLHTAHGDIMDSVCRSGDADNDPTYYQRRLYEELGHLLEDRNLYHLGLGAAIKEALPWDEGGNFDFPFITLAVSENTQFYINAYNAGNYKDIVRELNKVGN